MAIPTNTEIDNAIPVAGTPNRGLANVMIKNITAFLQGIVAPDVEAVFGRTGAITAQANDYTADQISSTGTINKFVTQAEKDKLAGLESSKFLGTYVNIGALNTAHPSPAEGSYAYVDTGIGGEVQSYIWDHNDDVFVAQAGSSTSETAASVKTKYESNPNTNAFTDAEQSKLSGLATVATSGSYSDLTGAPSPLAVAALNAVNIINFTEGFAVAAGGSSSEAVVSFTGSISPQKVTPVNADFVMAFDSENSDNIVRIPWTSFQTSSSETAASVKTKYESNPNTNAFTDAEQSKLSGLATVATSGSYSDLINPPVIPARVQVAALTDIAAISLGNGLNAAQNGAGNALVTFTGATAPEKATPVDADFFLGIDSANSNGLIRIPKTSVGGGGASLTTQLAGVSDVTTNTINFANTMTRADQGGGVVDVGVNTVDSSTLTEIDAVVDADYIVGVDDPAGTPLAKRYTFAKIWSWVLVKLQALTTKTTPTGTDYVLVYDQAASGTPKRALISSLPSGGGGGGIAFARYNQDAMVNETLVSFDCSNIITDVANQKARVTVMVDEPGENNWALTFYATFMEPSVSNRDAYTLDIGAAFEFDANRVDLTGSIAALTLDRVSVSFRSATAAVPGPSTTLDIVNRSGQTINVDVIVELMVAA